MHTHLPVIPGSGENPAWQGMSEQTAMLLVAVCIRWGLRPGASYEDTIMCKDMDVASGLSRCMFEGHCMAHPARQSHGSCLFRACKGKCLTVHLLRCAQLHLYMQVC